VIRLKGHWKRGGKEEKERAQKKLRKAGGLGGGWAGFYLEVPNKAGDVILWSENSKGGDRFEGDIDSG